MSIDVTDATFATEVMERSKSVPVVVDLWAEWCGPCRTLGPIIEKVVGETGGKVVLAKVNVDENHGLAARYGIRSIPTVLFVKDGKVVDQVVGAVPRTKLKEKLAALGV